MKADVKGGPVRHTIGADGTFVLRTVAGTVSLRGTTTTEAEVVARQRDGEPAPLVVNRSAGALHIEPEQKGRSFFGGHIGINVPEIDFEIELPHGARIELQSVSADVIGSNLRGDQSYKLVSGDLQLSDVGGRLEAKSVSGDISLRAAQPVEVSAVTTSGDVLVAGAAIDVLRLRTVSGDATVRGAFASGPEHRVETVSGDLIVEPTAGLTIEASGPIVGLRSSIAGQVLSESGRRGLVVGDGAARLRFRSMSGEVRVEGDAPVDQPGRPQPAAGQRPDALEILRAVERGELDVEQASRLLAEDGFDA